MGDVAFLGPSGLMLSRVVGWKSPPPTYDQLWHETQDSNISMPYISCESLHKVVSFRFQLSWQHQTCRKFPSNKWEQIWRCKQITVFVMWITSASLSGIFPLLNHTGAWASESSTTRLPPSDSQYLYCTSPENHILRRGTQSTAMPPWTGKLVTQSELFTDDSVAPLKILQSLLSLEAKLWRAQRHFKERQ